MLRGFVLICRLTLQSYAQFSRQSAAPTTLYRAALMTLLCVLLLPWLLCNGMCLWLDRWIFRFEKIQPRNPLFIVGVPRSGTTFLHRLCGLNPEFTTMPLWEILLAPSLIQKYFWWGVYALDRLLGGFGYGLLVWSERKLFGALDNIHRTSLFEPEEDYLALIPVAGCFLLVHAFPGAPEIWELAFFDRDASAARRQQVMAYYRGIVQRHLYFRGTDRILLSKNPSFTGMIDSLRTAFPDCAIVACRRTPQNTVPSLLNSMESGARLFGNSLQPEHFRDCYVRMLQYFYERLHAPGLEIVEYDMLTADAYAVVTQIHRRFEFALPSDFDDNLRKAAEAAQGYRSKHRYSAEQFGLTTDQIDELFQGWEVRPE